MVRGGSSFDDYKEKLKKFDRKLTYGSKYGSIPGEDGSKQIDFNKYDLSGLENDVTFQRLKKEGDVDKINKEKFKYIKDKGNAIRTVYGPDGNIYKGVRYKTIGVIIVLSVLSIIMSILVADIYNNSSKKITEDETAQGAYTYVISSITAVIAVLATLIISLTKQYKLSFFMILFGIFGIVTSYIGINWIENDPDMSKKYSKDKKKFLIAAIVIWIMVIIAGMVSLAL
tara:strand:- start:508 stop:1191 length:684 start_codon:yes stop_codon:yes gene_type:complete